MSLQLVVAGMLITVLLTAALVYFFVVQRTYKNRHYQERQQLLLELQNKELTVSFEERELMMTQVSKELHDNVGQIAHLSRMHLHVIEELASDEAQLKLIRYVANLTDQMISDTNHISHSLNSDFMKKRGLERALEDDLDHIKASGDIACYMNVQGSKWSLDPERQLVVYRIAQEAIHNVLKHAKASLLEISITYSEQSLTLRIHDDGIGFDAEKARSKGTLGITNMTGRAKLLGTTIDIDTAIGKGTTVTLVVEAAGKTG